MSLDVNLRAVREVSVYDANITHNLSRMADEAGIYKHLWCPQEVEITSAQQLIEPLERGLALLRAEPEKFLPYNPANGWGSYETLVKFVEEYIAACKAHPDATVVAHR